MSGIRSPQQFQPELYLPRSRRSGRNDSGRGRRSAARGRVYDGIRRIEVRVIEKVEEFEAGLQVQSF